MTVNRGCLAYDRDKPTSHIPQSQVAATSTDSGASYGAKYRTPADSDSYPPTSSPQEKMPCSEKDFQQMPLDFVRESHAIMWNNGSLYKIKGKFVDDSAAPAIDDPASDGDEDKFGHELKIRTLSLRIRSSCNDS